jgi:hypothetical protein
MTLPAEPMLTAARIARLVAALRAQGAPVVNRLAAGLSDAAMDDIVAPLDIVLPAEAKTWWGQHNGAPLCHGDDSSLSLSPAWWWAPLEVVVAHCLQTRALSDASMWMSSWLPIVVGEGELVIDTVVGPTDACSVHVIDFEGDELDGAEHVPTLPSLGALVDVWTRAAVGDAIRWAPDLGYFTVNWDRADELGIPDGVL